jgi:hypothetical protein
VSTLHFFVCATAAIAKTSLSIQSPPPFPTCLAGKTKYQISHPLAANLPRRLRSKSQTTTTDNKNRIPNSSPHPNMATKRHCHPHISTVMAFPVAGLPIEFKE